MYVGDTNPIVITTLVLLAVCVGPSLQQVQLVINPSPAIAEEEVVFTCKNLHSNFDNIATVGYILEKDSKEVFKLDSLCSEGASVDVTKNTIGATAEFSCTETKIKVAKATRSGVAGNYQCTVSMAQKNYKLLTRKTVSPVALSVGDRTPPVKEFSLKDETRNQVANGSTVDAGAKLNVTCRTAKTDPLPGFTVDVTGQATRRNRTADSEFVVFALAVPRVPRVDLKCSVFNGYGDRKQATLFLLPKYKAIAAEIAIPKEVVVQTDDEVTVCEVANSPPQRVELAMDGADELLEDGYPRYVESAEEGKSLAIVKFSAKAQSLQSLEVTCRLPAGLGEKKETITLSAPKSAMMMIGIVVACLIVFLLVVAGLAYICKRRDAAKSSSNDRSYKTVNQNDTDGRGASRKLDNMPSTAV